MLGNLMTGKGDLLQLLGATNVSEPNLPAFIFKSFRTTN